MTTTAHEDQFTAAPEPVRQPYDTVAILRRNVAALEVAMRTQTERAEAADAELAKLRDQKPVAWRYQDANGNYRYRGYVPGFDVEYNILKPVAIYAVPVPAPHKGATHCDDCGLTWLDDGLNPLRCPYCKDTVPAPAVPAEWREVMAELAADAQAACDAEHPHRDQYPSVMRKYNNDMEIVEKARALLQSARVNPQYYDQVGTESYERHQCVLALESLLARIEVLRVQNAALREDSARIDWLADVNNTVGSVVLPRHIVEQNISSLRQAIDAAMTAKTTQEPAP